MNKITVSAPGKLMLLGEHAVLHGSPCLVTAVDQRMTMNVELTCKPEFQLEAPDVKIRSYKKPMNELGKGNIPKGARFVEKAAVNLLSLQEMDNRGIRVTTKSEFSSEFGIGSSSAVTVCVIKAISELLDLKLSDKEIFDISYKSVLDIQGKGSGFDVAAAVNGGTLYYITGGEVIEDLDIKLLPLVVGYSGVKGNTTKLIKKTEKDFSNRQNRLEELYNGIEDLVNQGKEALTKMDWIELGSLMNKNQAYLRELGVSTYKLDRMIRSSIKAGAYGAKVSGAGGGDCMIALVGDKRRMKVVEAIQNAGGKIININAGAEGVRVG